MKVWLEDLHRRLLRASLASAGRELDTDEEVRKIVSTIDAAGYLAVTTFHARVELFLKSKRHDEEVGMPTAVIASDGGDVVFTAEALEQAQDFVQNPRLVRRFS